MPDKKNTKTKKLASSKLVLAHLENVSSEIFAEYPQEIAQMVRDHHGVYALYKKSKLYYVGLAIKLGIRLKQHLKDKHAGKWDRFSLYLVRDSDHIKEIESLLLRIADPSGNAVKGKLVGAENMRPGLKKQIKQSQDSKLEKMLDLRKSKCARPQQKGGGGKYLLASIVSKPFEIRRTYKNVQYKAKVRSDGSISYNGEIYDSLSKAASLITGRPTNGWFFWTYKNTSGEWTKINKLRK
jgi:hypothetical protein